MNYYVLPALFIFLFTVYAFSVVLSVAYEVPNAKMVLVLAFIFVLLSLLYKLNHLHRRSIGINYGFFLFLLLISYILLSLFLAENFSRLNYPIGMFYFFLMGVLLSFSINDLVDYANGSHKGARLYNRFLILFFLICLFSSAIVFFKILGATGSVFRLYSADIVGSYQNSGYYASMLFLIISYMMLNYLVLNANIVKRYYVYSVKALYISTFFFLLLTAILMGSNYTVVTLISMFLIFFFVYRLHVSKRGFLIQSHFNLSSLFSGFVILKFILFFLKISALIALIIFVINVSFGAQLIGGNLDGVRLFDTSETGAINSLLSRIEILKHFDMQFSIAPFLGNMYADDLTTGSGTAAHSLVLSLLSHTGVIGFLLFCVFFVSIFLSLMYFNFHSEIHTRVVKFFAFYTIVFVFLFASISNVFYSPFIWFSFGFLGFFLKVRNI